MQWGKNGGKGEKWIYCVQSDVRAFGKTGDWKVTASGKGVWFETITEGGLRFKAGRGKE